MTNYQIYMENRQAKRQAEKEGKVFSYLSRPPLEDYLPVKRNFIKDLTRKQVLLPGGGIKELLMDTNKKYQKMFDKNRDSVEVQNRSQID